MYHSCLVTMLLVGAATATPCVPAETFSLFEDLALDHGFRLSALRSSMTPVEIGPVLVADPGKAPQWRLAQWGSRFSLESAEMRLLDGGARILENEGKHVKVLPGGLAGAGLLLAVHGGKEYGGALRQYGEAWPHLLIEQRLTPRPLNTLSSLDFTVEFRVETCAPATSEALDTGLHTAHISAFWTVHNINSESADHNNMIWFGLPLFDARYPIPPGHQALDVGQEDATGKFICTIEGKRFYTSPIQPGEWHTLACDLLPLLREALEAAQKQGFLTHTRAEDLAATSFNLGWEVPGPYDCAITLRGLSLRGSLMSSPAE